MNNISKSILIALVFAVPKIMDAQWIRTSPTLSSNCFFENAGNLFAATSNGIYLYSDSESMWNRFDINLRDYLIINSLAAKDSIFFLGSEGSGIFR